MSDLDSTIWISGPLTIVGASDEQARELHALLYPLLCQEGAEQGATC